MSEQHYPIIITDHSESGKDRAALSRQPSGITLVATDSPYYDDSDTRSMMSAASDATLLSDLDDENDAVATERAYLPADSAEGGLKLSVPVQTGTKPSLRSRWGKELRRSLSSKSMSEDERWRWEVRQAFSTLGSAKSQRLLKKIFSGEELHLSGFNRRLRDELYYLDNDSQGQETVNQMLADSRTFNKLNLTRLLKVSSDIKDDKYMGEVRTALEIVWKRFYPNDPTPVEGGKW